MACCAFGSNRGYDELVPHHIHVVKEKRQYKHWESKYEGITKAKKALNDLHFKLGQEGFNEVFVDQMDADVVAVTRHNPCSHQSIVLIAHTAFNPGVNLDRSSTGLELNVEGQLLGVELEAYLHKTIEQDFVQDPEFINGLDNYKVDMRSGIQIQDAKFVRLASGPQEAKVRIELNNFKPGSVIAKPYQHSHHQGQARQA